MATDGKTTGVLDAERRRASFDATALEEIVNRGRAKAIAKVRYHVKAVFNYFLQYPFCFVISFISSLS